MSAPKKDRDHKARFVPGRNDKDRTAIVRLAGKPKVAAVQRAFVASGIEIRL